jgi:hypothetical protein
MDAGQVKEINHQKDWRKTMPKPKRKQYFAPKKERGAY